MSLIGKIALILTLLVLPSSSLAQTRASVDVGQLSEIKPFSITALTDSQRKLPQEQWLNSDVQVLQELMAELPAHISSRAINNLLIRSLLSGGEAPDSDTSLEKLMELRLNSSYSLGQLDAVIQIAARSPKGYQDPEIAATALNALLAIGDTQTACSIAEQLNQARSATFWLQVRAFCLAAASNIAGAELTAELAMSSDPEDTNFLTRISRITTPPKEKERVSPSSALELAMIRSAKDEVDLEGLALPLQVGTGRENTASAIDTIFDAFISGAISAEEISQRLLAYAKTFKAAKILETDTPELSSEPKPTAFEQELAALKQAKSLLGLDRIASLLTLANGPYDPKIRAESLTLLLEPKPDFPKWLALNQLIEIKSRSLTPNVSLKQYATVLARASLLAGKARQAKQWLSILESTERSIALIDMPLIATNQGFTLQEQSLQEQINGDAAQQNLLISDLMALQAINVQLSPKLRQWVSNRPETEGQACESYKLSALAASAQAGAIAETILRAANIMRSDGFDRLSNHCNQAIVSALWNVGLTEEAQLAAIEWMFARRQMQ